MPFNIGDRITIDREKTTMHRASGVIIDKPAQYGDDVYSVRFDGDADGTWVHGKYLRHDEMNKYQHIVKGVKMDVYDVLSAWGVTDPAIQHAIKKLLQPGARGHKSKAQDLQEALQSIQRAIDANP